MFTVYDDGRNFDKFGELTTIRQIFSENAVLTSICQILFTKYYLPVLSRVKLPKFSAAKILYRMVDIDIM